MRPVTAMHTTIRSVVYVSTMAMLFEVMDGVSFWLYLFKVKEKINSIWSVSENQISKVSSTMVK